MLKRITLWLSAVVFLALDFVGTALCFYLAFFGSPSNMVDDNPFILGMKGIGGILVAILIIWLAFQKDKDLRAAVEDHNPNGDFEPRTL